MATARRFIADRYGQRAGALTLLGTGEWSQAYAFTLDGRSVVVRFGAHGANFAKDQIMAAHTSTVLPVPKGLEIGEAPSGYFAVSERVRGDPLDELDGPSMRTILPGLLSALDALREVDTSRTQGYGIWDPDGVAPYDTWADALLAINQERDRTPGWRAALEASPAGAGAFDAGYAALREVVDDLPRERHIIHGDLLNRNVLVQPGEVMALLDWGNALYGDDLYDAAWPLYWWPWYTAWAKVDIRGELQRHWQTRGRVTADVGHRLHTYQLHIGLDALSYSAFAGRWADVSRSADQVMALLRREDSDL